MCRFDRILFWFRSRCRIPVCGLDKVLIQKWLRAKGVSTPHFTNAAFCLHLADARYLHVLEEREGVFGERPGHHTLVVQTAKLTDAGQLLPSCTPQVIPPRRPPMAIHVQNIAGARKEGVCIRIT